MSEKKTSGSEVCKHPTWPACAEREEGDRVEITRLIPPVDTIRIVVIFVVAEVFARLGSRTASFSLLLS